MRKLILIIMLFALTISLIVAGCGKKDEPQLTADDIKKKELDLKEKELQLKEKELIVKKETDLTEREKLLDQKQNIKFNLNGRYEGTIKNGTYWYLVINGFDGKQFSGYNNIYWESSPRGYRTELNGVFDNSSFEVIMYEDKNIKGSGKFTGTISNDGKKMSGSWFRYSDNGSFTWELSKFSEENQ